VFVSARPLGCAVCEAGDVEGGEPGLAEFCGEHDEGASASLLASPGGRERGPWRTRWASASIHSSVRSTAVRPEGVDGGVDAGVGGGVDGSLDAEVHGHGRRAGSTRGAGGGHRPD
jgi:hypothetical protein